MSVFPLLLLKLSRFYKFSLTFVWHFTEWCENNAVGLANGLIMDNQLTASSEAAQAKNGRLNFTAGSSWCASTNDSNPYLEIDLKAVHIICAVSTQGNAQGSQWVETYFLQSSTDRITWTDYEEDGQIKVNYFK